MAPSTFNASTTASEAATFYASQIAGKTVLITGATPKGLGAEAARAIAQHDPKLLILAGRSQTNLDDAKSMIFKDAPSAKLETLVVDFASLASVRTAASTVKAYTFPIDVLILNHGIMGTPYTQTVDGFESQFAVCHLGSFLFTNLIKERLMASADPRVVVVSSAANTISNVLFEDPGFDGGKKYHAWVAYGQAKTANVQFAVGLAERWKIPAFSLHPGASLETNLMNDMPVEEKIGAGFLLPDQTPNPAYKYKTLEACSSTHIVAAFDPELKDKSGAFLSDCHINTEVVAPYALDKDDAAKLWALSEKLVGQKFD
ncbi:NAD-P-binding protein [Pseudohyphozyma bogoriensis]|nr:NAD-P-binding protein [Pseudohyphozyma bogoriensis]